MIFYKRNFHQLTCTAVHWMLLAYGITSLNYHYAFMCLVPFPTLFYILTVRFTDPGEFRELESRI